MTGEEAYNYLLGLLELEDDIRWPLVKECMNKFKELIDQQAILKEYNITPEILREVLLTGQMFRNQPTLEQCIKEWENRKWKIEIFKDEKNKDISIFGTKQPNKNCYEIFKISAKLKVMSLDGVFTLDMVHLLLKTLTALEVENDKN